MWNTSLDLSLVGLVSRPDEYRFYKIEDWSLLKIVKKTNHHYAFRLAPDTVHLSLATGFDIPISKVSFLRLHYAFYYARLRCDPGKPLTRLYHSLGLGVVL